MVATVAGAVAAYLLVGIGVTTGIWCTAIAYGEPFPWVARIGAALCWPLAIRVALEEADG